MAQNRNYTEERVVIELRQKHDISIPQDRKQVVECFGSSAKGDVGIKSRGKIHFLVNYCGYVHLWDNWSKRM